MTLESAIESLRIGQPVMIHDFDDREGETDLVYPAGSVAPPDVARLRSEAGGLVCVALGHECAEAFELPYLHDALDHPAVGKKDIDYDDHPSFSLTVNHSSTRTGIPDVERSRTIRELATAAGDPEDVVFDEEFRAPGHVQLLKAAPSFENRRGHTELAIALVQAAGLPPAAVVCEMLEDGRGAMAKSAARKYASRADVPFVGGDDIIQHLHSQG